MTVPHESPVFVPLSQDHGAAGKGGWFAGNLEWMLALLINWLRGKSKALVRRVSWGSWSGATFINLRSMKVMSWTENRLV